MPADDPTFPSVWARPPRKERSTLTRDQIVRHAIELLDSEGSDALSMRKLAARLESGTTSLYWHVANRDELLELVVNELYGEVEIPDHEDWREVVRGFAASVRAVVLRHPWTITILDHLVAAYPGPNLQAVSERMLAVFEGAGFELREAEKALGTVSSFVIGITMSEASWRNWIARRGQSGKEAVAADLQTWLDVLAADHEAQDHGRLGALVAYYEGKDPQEAVDEDFAYGLDRVLDGLQARLIG